MTDDGRMMLRGWIAEQEDPTPDRASVAVRVRAAAATGDLGALRPTIEHHLAKRLERHENYREIELRDFPGADGVADTLQHVVLRAGLLVEQAWIEWSREVLAALDGLEGVTPDPGSTMVDE